jgi:ribose transport system permease protein
MTESNSPSSASASTSPSESALSLLGGSLGPLLALALVILFFAAAAQWQVEPDGKNNFVQVRTARTIAAHSSTVAVAALGMTLIIIAKGIDLSAGTAIALSATVLAWCLRAGYSAPLAVSVGLGTGIVAGLINGALVSTLRVAPFSVTLCTMTIYLGLGKYIGGNTTIRPLPESIPDWLSTLLKPTPEYSWMIVSPGVWGVLILACAVACLLRYSVFGRYIFALGSNESTARLCGINVPWTKIAVYGLSGFFVGVAGMYQFARLSQGDPTSGGGKELSIIAAVVIGGASLNGGRGSVLGTIAGAIMMQVIETGCTMLGLQNFVQNIIIGVIILAAVTIDRIRRRQESD